MLHAGLDLSRRKLDVCLLSDQGEHLDQLVSPPDGEALRTLARRIEGVHREPVRAVIESMTGARFVLAAPPRGDDRCAPAQGRAPRACGDSTSAPRIWSAPPVLNQPRRFRIPL
jgi:hypothetical protein